MRSTRRLTEVLGGEPNELSWDQLKTLIANGVEESEDLDFKASHYGNSDNDKRELAKDVAALANSSGGVLLIGVQEDEFGKASALTLVSIDQNMGLKYRQIIASSVSPLVLIDIHVTPSPADASLGVLIIEVQPSQMAPHGVIVNDGLRFPYRNGNQTIYLREHQVADAYRRRFSSGEDRISLMNKRESDFLSTLDDSHTWLVMTLIPDYSQIQTLTRVRFKELKKSLQGQGSTFPGAGYVLDQVRGGYRRVRAEISGPSGQILSKYSALELHTDGSGCYGLELAEVNFSSFRREASEDSKIINDETLAYALMGGLVWLGSHAGNCSSQGMANFRVQVWPSDPAHPMGLGYSRGGFPGVFNQPIRYTGAVELSIPISQVIESGTEMIIAAGEIGREVAQSMGTIEMMQFTEDGKVRQRYWGSRVLPHVKKWCTENGVELTDEVLG